MNGDSGKPLSEEEYIRELRAVAAEGDLDGLRGLLNTEFGQEGLDGLNLDPSKDEDLENMMSSLRKQIGEGDAFRRGVGSEGRKLSEIERMALEAGVTPDTLIRGSIEKGRRRGGGSKRGRDTER